LPPPELSTTLLPTTSPLGLIHQLQHTGRFERREREQKQEAGHELRPDEKRQPEEPEAFRAKLDDGDDEVDRAEQ
jgi:hypothetical protein